MRMSRLFLRTLRDDPADADVDSHRLLVRAGYIRKVAAGIYSWLPLGSRVVRKVAQIVREIADELRSYKSELGALVSLEMGKILQEGWGEWPPSRRELRRQLERCCCPAGG